MLSRASRSTTQLRLGAVHAALAQAAGRLPARRQLSLNPLPNQGPNISNDMPGEDESRGKDGPKRSSAAFDSALGTIAGQSVHFRQGAARKVPSLTGSVGGLVQGWEWSRLVVSGITIGTSGTCSPR